MTLAAPGTVRIGWAAEPFRYLLLALLALFIVLPGISTIPPLDRDESRYVQATKQMLETGDYVDIRMQEKTRYKKPVGIYWLQSVAVKLGGAGAAAPLWNYRLVSVLGVLAAVLSLCWTGSRLFGAKAGFVSGLLLAATFAVAFEGRIAKTDAVVLALVILAQGALAQIHLSARKGLPVAGHLPWLFWAAQGCGILVKGPIAPLASALTIAALFALERDRRWLRELKAGPGLVVAGAICLPWLALITWKSGGAFWQESVGRDLVGKLADGQESHGAPPGFYVLTYGLYLWPFGLLLLDAGLRAWNSARGDPRLQFLLCWYVPFWLFFELVPTKLPHYVIPAYPGLILIAGWALTHGRAAEAPALRTWQTALWWLAAAGQILVSAAIAALAVAAPLVVGQGFSPVGIAAAFLALLAGLLALPRGEGSLLGPLAAATAAAGLTYALIFGLVFPSLTQIWLSPRIADAVEKHRLCEDTVLASADFHEPSLVFLTATDTVLTGPVGAAEHLLGDPDCALALVSAESGTRFEARLNEVGKTARVLTQVEGMNYSSGDRLALTLYRLTPEGMPD